MKRALGGQDVDAQSAMLAPAGGSPAADPAAGAVQRATTAGGAKPPAGVATQRKVHRGAIQMKAGDVVQRVDDPPTTTPETTPRTPETTPETTPEPEVPPMTKEEATGHARDVEVKFGAEAAGAGAGLTGAQALVDSALIMMNVHVALWNQRLALAQQKGEQADAKFKSVSDLVKTMGTRPTSREGVSMKSVAGAVPPDKVAKHLQEGAGNLRTKMTAIFNFMGTLSKMVLDELRSGDTTFFDAYEEQGELLKQQATSAEIKIAEAKKKAEEKAKGTGKEPEAVRESILGPAKSKAASEQHKARFDKDDDVKTTQDKIGTSEDPYASERLGNDTSIGPALHEDEIAFMGLEVDKLGEQHLTWREGLDIYKMDQEHWWIDAQNKIGLPIGAGPASGTTDRLMQTGAQLGCTPMGTRAATLGYLLSINAHTLVEILTSAAPYSGEFTEPLDGFGMYKEIKPFGSLKKHANKRFWDEKVAPPTGGDSGGSSE